MVRMLRSPGTCGLPLAPHSIGIDEADLEQQTSFERM